MKTGFDPGVDHDTLVYLYCESQRYVNVLAALRLVVTRYGLSMHYATGVPPQQRKGMYNTLTRLHKLCDRVAHKMDVIYHRRHVFPHDAVHRAVYTVKPLLLEEAQQLTTKALFCTDRRNPEYHDVEQMYNLVGVITDIDKTMRAIYAARVRTPKTSERSSS